jgi:hypothetical protein
LNPVAIKNKELREYIIGKDDFEYNTLIEQMILPLKDALNLIKIQSKETLSWEETLCNASGEESFHRKFIPYLMRTAL